MDPIRHWCPSPSARVGLATVLTWLLTAGAGSPAHAAAVKPRFVFVVDTSGSMAENAARIKTHGDGSVDHPGCDLDNNGRYDDAKLFAAKAALTDTITAFGAAEFALARYDQQDLGQSCNVTNDCTTAGFAANACIGNQCAYDIPTVSPDYNECVGGTATGNGCIRCAAPAGDPSHVWTNGNLCCGAGSIVAGGHGVASDVLVGFPSSGARNETALLSWIDGRESLPGGGDPELRATGLTPIGAALNGVRDWLVNDASQVGPGGGVLNQDPNVDCRSYNVILITDGIESDSCVTNCGVNGALAADELFHACTNGGFWDPVDERCELAGNPAGTRRIRVRTYVVGFTVNDASLNSISASGGTGIALLANDRAELTARLGDIIAASIPAEKCDCADNTCDGAVDEIFPSKGQPCTVGVGRCKRQGVLACGADGSAVVCSPDSGNLCPAQGLPVGQGAPEGCGSAPGCLAPSAQDCADDDCDGLIDENLSCSCNAKPETCNARDDDCNGLTDDISVTPCGLSIGQCTPGTIACADDGAGGKTTVCVGGSKPQPELCDNLDNDCDGITDGFGVACFPAGTAGCAIASSQTGQICGGAPVEAFTCTGICQTGLLSCEGGVCGACQGAVIPRTEVACDGLDNDCDGMTDEGFGLGDACGPGVGQPGACRAGVLTCIEFRLQCVGGQGPAEEICNRLDDDCDGQTDNLAGACGLLTGACVPGVWHCVGGQPSCDQRVGPEPELCDGKDNDCDGSTDEEPTDADLTTVTMCGTAVGECVPGVLACLGGGKYCTGGVEPVFERCNARDDDCDGMTDDAINPPGPCPPPGLPMGAPLAGDCRPGDNVCLPDGTGGALWTCTGGVGPATELCDGRDNDCDAVIDDGAACAEGFVCTDGECAPRCLNGEFECPADRTCSNGVCVYHLCVRTPCPYGFYCDGRKGCLDRCAGVNCPAGYLCDNGMCTSCQTSSCPPGQLCRVTSCEPDPCAAVTCAGTDYCRGGACVATCNGVKCPSGQSCRAGACVADLCRAAHCAYGEFCRPETGACEKDPCGLIVCLRGQVCVPALAACVADPCQLLACKGEDACLVRADGVAECLSRDLWPKSPPIARVTASGSGCSCAVGGPQTNGAPGALAGLAFAVLGALRWRGLRRRNSR